MRGEWNVLLLAAICVLLAVSPSAGASLAASPLSVSSLTTATAPAQYEAMLWWLQCSAERTANFASAARSTPLALDAVVASALAADVTAIDVAANIVSIEEHAQQISAARAATSFTTADTSDSSTSAVPHSPQVAPRYDATRRFALVSLASHEAGQRSGTRTNRFHE